MFLIRNAVAADAATIVDIANKTWWTTYAEILATEQIQYMLNVIYDVDKISQQIENATQEFLILEENGQPVAFASYSPREEDKEIYKLHKLYCLPQTQGKGYGKILINAVADKVRQAGKHILELNVNRYNQATGFYEKMGFSIAYEEDVPIGPYWMNDYVMRKPV
ncbi:GNAT family N-acetyltransferase [Mucilaginibacter lacusdianchii]|uniref:GNAT family N-acetyltransferase n=1 Tax=Mucilaginibacter lacusdianchii TaxID=2684211 RepID=UPI00131BB2A5|nr:GNAT family N-acetyltransferase [Mucilaginibacter sp. JXJ CY 39]